ncbi:MAG TPA: hypothetical protein VIJ80_00230 [Candidatus Cryosericum sp.]
MDIRKYLSEYGTRLAHILDSLAASVGRYSPQLLTAAMITSLGDGITTASGLGIVTALVGKEVATGIMQWMTGKTLDRLFTGKSSETHGATSQELVESVRGLSELLADLSQQHMSVDASITDFTQALVESDEFMALSGGVRGLGEKIDDLKSDVVLIMREIQEERDAQATTGLGLSTIQALLGKETHKTPMFFRPSGPAWVDFKEGYVIERPVVGEVIKRLESKDIVVVKGSPASGKSVIVRNVGYRLATKPGVQVYHVGLKFHPRPETLSGISKIRHGYVIVDDAQLDKDFVQNLLLLHQDRVGKRAKLIIASRDVDMETVYGPTAELLMPEYLEDEETIKVLASDAARDIVEKFDEKMTEKDGVTVSVDPRSELARDNLWVLAWQLKSFENLGKVDSQSVLETVSSYLRRIGDTVDAGEAMLLVAMFYQYEILVRMPFLKSFVRPDSIAALEASGEVDSSVWKGRDYVGLWHSEVARIYFRAFEVSEDLGLGVKNAVLRRHEELFGRGLTESCNLTLMAFRIYLSEYPEETPEIISALDDEDAGADGKILIKGLCARNMGGIVAAINSEPSGILAVLCVRAVLVSADDTAAHTFMDQLDSDVLAVKLGKEKSLNYLGTSFYMLAEASRPVAKKVLGAFDLGACARRASETEDLDSLGYCVARIADIDVEAARKMVGGIDLNVLTAKFRNEESVDTAAKCLGRIADVSEPAARTIAESLDVDVTAARIRSCNDVGRTGECIGLIAAASKSMANRILVALGTSELEREFRSETHLDKVSEGIRGIANTDQSLAGTILESLDCEELTTKVNSEADVKIVGDALWKFSRCSKRTALTVLKGLDMDALVTKMNVAADAESISNCLWGVHIVSVEIGARAAEAVDDHAVAAAIGRQGDLAIGILCLCKIATASPQVAMRILSQVDSVKLRAMDPESPLFDTALAWVREFRGTDEKLFFAMLGLMPPEMQGRVLGSLFSEEHNLSEQEGRSE